MNERLDIERFQVTKFKNIQQKSEVKEQSIGLNFLSFTEDEDKF